MSVFVYVCVCVCVCVCVRVCGLRVTSTRKWAGQQCGILKLRWEMFKRGQRVVLMAEVCCPENMRSSWGSSLPTLLSVPCPWLCTQKTPSTSNSWDTRQSLSLYYVPILATCFFGIKSKSFLGCVLETQVNKMTPGRE